MWIFLLKCSQNRLLEDIFHSFYPEWYNSDRLHLFIIIKWNCFWIQVKLCNSWLTLETGAFHTVCNKQINICCPTVIIPNISCIKCQKPKMECFVTNPLWAVWWTWSYVKCHSVNRLTIIIMLHHNQHKHRVLLWFTHPPHV